MNKFGMREALEMFEMLRDSACMIDHYTDYINHCQDPQLRQILENQQRRMVDNYHQKVSIIQGHGIDINNIPRFQSQVAGQQGTAQAGMAGMQGSQGLGGMQGARGMTGMQGAQGMTGMQGTQGMAGMQGATGLTGIYGGAANIQFGMTQPGQAQNQQQAQSQPIQSRSGVLNDRTIAQGALIFHKCGAARATTAALESAEPHLRNLAANSARACMDMAYEVFRYMEQKGFYQMPDAPGNFVNHMQSQVGQINPVIQQGYQAGAQGFPGQLS